MDASKVTTFFYGSYMNPAVLREFDMVPDRIEVARLPGFDIVIRPLANLVPSDGDTVYGVVVNPTHAELDHLYSHARDVLGGTYLPQAVLVYTQSRTAEAALCYIAPELSGAPASADYVEKITRPARAYGFPDWYIGRLESFLP